MRCPTIVRSPVAARLASASWTLFSPKSICPSDAASRTASAPKVFETAMSLMWEGSRPARAAARAMRSRTSASLVWITLFRELSDERLRRRGVGAVRGEVEIRVELLARFLQLAFVHQSHRELVVRLGVVRVRGD